MKKSELRNYAALIARKGGNIQKGQEVVIRAGLDQPEFVQMLVEECYRAGAGKVMVEWNYDALARLHVRYQKEKTLCKTEDWELARLTHRRDTLPVMIHLESEDPDGLKGINQKKYMKAIQAKSLVAKPYRDAMENKYQWCIAGVPGEAWAKKMYPHLRKSQAVEQLWRDILRVSRAEGDAVANWTEHNAGLRARCDHLNALKLRKLHYTAGNGTDLTVGLIPGAVFAGGSEKTRSGVEFNPNIPSEEVFTSPKAGEAEGIVYATRPLSYMGQLIEDFSVRFEGGRAVEVHAGRNEELLKAAIAMDPNAAMLGECALIPASSPISQSGLLFYSTLYDENASCHLALGAGFNECYPGYEKYSKAELQEIGINDSLIHEDFMIGCESMDIDGYTEDGQCVPIFRHGEWAF